MSLKVRLLLGAAVPLVFTAPALAQVTINTATTTPVSTSTVDDGDPGDIVIATGGSITLDEQPGATAVTIDSNNTLTHGGAIALPDSDNATGVRIHANLTTGYTGTGVITLLEDYTREDLDDDGDPDGPVAIGTGRTGILLEAGGVMTGDIMIMAGGITIEGNDSYGISLRSELDGSYFQKGNISMTGADTIALDIRENVSGDVQVGGGINVNGENAVGVRILGDVGGEFLIDGTVFATGFTSTTISNYADPDFLGPNDVPIEDRRDPDDLLEGGPAVVVRGNLAYGALINGPAVGGADATPDVKDVIQNFNENRSTGNIGLFGSGPALLIAPEDGAAGSDLYLGLVRESVRDTLDDDDDDDLMEIIAVFDYDHGFINRGAVSANGFNIGFAPVGVRIAGSDDGLHETFVEGGIFNGGSISAQSFEANSIGLNIGRGATTPEILNTGSITATTFTETDHVATALLIEAGANVSRVENSGFIGSNMRGYDGEAVAFRDLSGTVTEFVNSSRVVAGFTDDDPRDDITSGAGRAIAIDLSHGSSNVTLTQVDTIGNARIFGEVLFGAGDDRFNIYSGEVRGDVDFGLGANTLDITGGALFGNATFGGGGAAVGLNNGRMTGNLLLGNASGSLSFTNNAVFNGDIVRTGGGSLSLSINNATMNSLGDDALALSTMSVANNGRVGFAVDLNRINDNTPAFVVSGTADLAADTVFTPIFEQFVNQAYTLRVLEAGTLNLGGAAEAMLNANSPYLFDMTLVRPNGEDALDLNVRVKTASELGLNTRQASAYESVLDLLEQNDNISTVIAGLSTEASFHRGWSDLMPANDAAIVRVLATNANAGFGAAAHRLDLISEKPDAPEGAWLEEFGVYHDSDRTSGSLGVSGGGFGIAAGLDLFSTANTVLGAFASLESVELDEKERNSAPLSVAQTSIGAYGGWRSGNLAVNGAAAVGFGKFKSNRTVATDTLQDNYRAEWDAVTWKAGVRANYTIPAGPFDLRPYASLDYINVSQDSYTETGSTIDALALAAGKSDTSMATAGAGLRVVGNFGSGATFRIRPEISAGYRSILSWDNSPATMSFAGGSEGQTFDLTPGVEPGDAVVAGLAVNIGSQFLNLKLGYDAEIADDATTHYGSLTLRVAFW